MMNVLNKREANFYITNAFNDIGDNNSYDADPYKRKIKLELKQCGFRKTAWDYPSYKNENSRVLQSREIYENFNSQVSNGIDNSRNRFSQSWAPNKCSNTPVDKNVGMTVATPTNLTNKLSYGKFYEPEEFLSKRPTTADIHRGRSVQRKLWNLQNIKKVNTYEKEAPKATPNVLLSKVNNCWMIKEHKLFEANIINTFLLQICI